MKTDEIRHSFLKFFKGKAHKIVPSDSLVSPDPTLLFTSAGMNQFKDKFIGENLTFTRAASCQKCLRTGDLNKIGKTSGHHTFFEMLGNFSFGDYFKQDAIKWAWEYLVKILRINPDSLWISVYEDDDEAYRIWKDLIEIPPDKIVRLGPKENFWPSNVQEEGPNGPCGPCSEIFHDQGIEAGCGKPDCGPACECDRFVEIWNLVFTQYERKDDGKLEPLPMKNIDTGMGLERIAAVTQEVRTNYEIDIFKPIVETIKAMSQEPRAKSSSIYAIADHIRAIVFAISDGIAPSSDERGYVIRKLVGKTVRHGRAVGIKEDFLTELTGPVIEVMKTAYPELKEKEEIIKIIKAEESRHDIIGGNIEKSKQKDETKFVVYKKDYEERIPINILENVLPGDEIFKLYDTHGIPLNLIEEVCNVNSLKPEMKEFQELMQKQRQRSRQKSKIEENIFTTDQYNLRHLPKTKFVGYEDCESKSVVLGILKNTEFVETANKNDKIFIILDKTPFYAEAGGQVGDVGRIFSNNFDIEVFDTISQNEHVLHRSKVLQGEVKVEDEVCARIDCEHRLDVARNHSATHLLHWVLREELGTHVRQAGSLVSSDKLRFDFSHFKALTSKELDKIERLINKKIMQDINLKAEVLEKEEAKKKGALVFFKDKYQSKVRVVTISDFSKEFCGGTHLERTGQIGIFKIVNETSVASGIRRIEAISGEEAYNYLRQSEFILRRLSEILKVEKGNIIDSVEQKLNLIKSLNITITNLNKKQWSRDVEKLVNTAHKVYGINIITNKLPSANISNLGNFLDLITNNYKSCVAVIGSVFQDKAFLVTGVTQDLLHKNIHAGEIVKRIARLIGGSGGGKASFAQAGGKNISQLDGALKKSIEIISDYIREKTK